MSEIFISYSRRDRFFAERLVNELVTLGVDVFWDRDIPPGAPWTKSVDNAIKSADYILVSLSPDYLASTECQRQLNLSLLCETHGDALVIPMIIEDCKLPGLLRHKVFADFKLDFDTGFNALTLVLINVGAGVTESILVGYQGRFVSDKKLAKLKRKLEQISEKHPPPPRVFLCHAQEDKKYVDHVYSVFGESGLDPWYDKAKLVVGDNWESEILKAIKESDFFVIFLSAVSINKRGFIHREVRAAVKEYQNRPSGMVYFIPVRLDNCQVPEIRLDTNTVLSDFQWKDLRVGYLEDISALAEAIWKQWTKRTQPPNK